MSGYRFSFDLRNLSALVALGWLASFAHEFTHHATAALLCGGVGRMSLSLFVTADGCGARWPWTTAAGPLLSYALMWTGMMLLLRRRAIWWGFALVIANKPLLRLVTALAGGGDEGMLWDLVSAGSSHWLATASVALLCLPPLAACWWALASPRRSLVLAGALMLPMLPLLGVPFLDRALYGAWIGGERVLPSMFGVPWSVWGIEAGVLVLLLALYGALVRRGRALTAFGAT